MLPWHVHRVSCISLLLSVTTEINRLTSSFPRPFQYSCNKRSISLHPQVLLFLQTKEKENHTASQMTLDTDRSRGVTYALVRRLVMKIISVVTTCVSKDSLLETKMSYSHTSFCGCLTFIWFCFVLFSNLTFTEALKFCQHLSALPVSERSGPVRWCRCLASQGHV